MPIPADVVRRKLKTQLKGLSEPDKVQLLKKTLNELPGYTSGPYGRLKRWIKNQIKGAEKQTRVVHRESFMVAKEGDCTAVLVGAPNCGKSSLLSALTGRQVRIGNYPFTTLKPVAGMVKVDGAYIQLVEVPGLVEGAAEGKGNGKAFLSAVRAADVAVFVGALTEQGFNQFCTIYQEVVDADIDLPGFVIASKCDLPSADAVFERYEQVTAGKTVIRASAETREGFDDVLQHLWKASGLIRVFPHTSGDGEGEPIIMKSESTVREFSEEIHSNLSNDITQARIWGPSAKFPGQLAPIKHRLKDGDRVQLITS